MNRLILLSNQITKTYSNIIVSIKGSVGQILLNSAKNLNSLTASMMKEIS
jgi:enoyl-CoA hydratase/carnithine racemase